MNREIETRKDEKISIPYVLYDWLINLPHACDAGKLAIHHLLCVVDYRLIILHSRTVDPLSTCIIIIRSRCQYARGSE
jgi:hypothetical protein